MILQTKKAAHKVSEHRLSSSCLKTKTLYGLVGASYTDSDVRSEKVSPKHRTFRLTLAVNSLNKKR